LIMEANIDNHIIYFLLYLSIVTEVLYLPGVKTLACLSNGQ